MLARDSIYLCVVVVALTRLLELHLACKNLNLRLFGWKGLSISSMDDNTLEPTAQKSVFESRRVSTKSIKSDSAHVDTAISYQNTSPMNPTSMCPTAASSSVKTAQSPYTSCALSHHSSRSRVPKPVLFTSSKQKVSARTGVSMNRLEGSINNRQGAQLSDSRDVRSETEVSHLEDSASTAILWDSDSVMTARSTSLSQLTMNTATTQPSMTAPHLDSASASRRASREDRSRTPGRHTPVTNCTAKYILASSTTKTARSMTSTTSHGPGMPRGMPNRSQSISTARPYSPYSTNRSSMSPYRSPGAAPTHVYPNQLFREQPLGSISQAPLLSSLTGRSSGLEISDNEAIGRGIGRSLIGDISGSSTSRNRLATKKARPCKKVPISEPRGQTSQDLNSTSTYATTNYDELSASAVSETGAVATTLPDPGKRREYYRQCRKCGKSRTSASAWKKPVPAENPSVQLLQTNDGLRFRVKMRLDARGLIKTGNSVSTAQFDATASACLPAGVEPEKAMINENVDQAQPSSHQ